MEDFFLTVIREIHVLHHDFAAQRRVGNRAFSLVGVTPSPVPGALLGGGYLAISIHFGPH